MTLVDTNVLIDILSRDPIWFSPSLGRFSDRASVGPMVIVDVVYAECATAFASAEQTTAALDALGIQRSAMSDAALWRAGWAFRDYRRRGGARANVLPDFFIGAQASVLGISLLTRDLARYQTYFPEVTLITP